MSLEKCKRITKSNKKVKPYIKKLFQLSKISVWLVDGEYIRKNICEDFVNYAHHYNFSFIPKNEFWIANGASKEEIRFYIYRMLVEQRLVKQGLPFQEAKKKAAIAEYRERKKSEFVKKLEAENKKKDILVRKVHSKLLKKYCGKVKVWLVNCELVRSFFDLDFGGGGHDRVYHYIPKNEVWIDDDIHTKERKFIILHELHERNLMSRGMSYPNAHLKATKMEDYYRHHKKNIVKAIKEEIKKQKVF